MDVSQRMKLQAFGDKHATARKRLAAWYRIICESQFSNFVDLRKTFSTQVDYVAPFYVFNIGDQFRLVAAIDFSRQRVIVRDVLTHREYDRGKWKN